MDFYIDKENMIIIVSLNVADASAETIEKIKAGFDDNFIYQVMVVENVNSIIEI
ncbi:hypothetical protein [Staphylococcus succinus]|uniref:hypothetical protein n=1 Tax=Staphylococcus succinus TaxID=61015 RepID=UPI00301D8641